MRIVVMGAGSMGCLLGGYLARADHEVFLVDPMTERTEAITTDGITVEGVNGDFEVKASAGPTYTLDASPDLVLVCVKAYDTATAASDIVDFLGADTAVLTLQNGVGNIERLAYTLPREQLLAGTTSLGANLLDPGRVHHAGEGETHIGDVYGERSDRAEGIAAVLTAARLPAVAVDDIHRLVWNKLAVNVGINALTALLRVRNGRILAAEGATRIMEPAVAECIAVAEESGVRLDAAEVMARVKDVARRTASNRSSMLMDMLGGRRTEIDAINGAVVHRGRELGVAVPVNETLTHLIHALESLREDREK
jgi:2-dehydropantoate 2-reductase